MIYWLNKKDLEIIITLPISMLKIINSSKNFWILINVVEKDKIIGKNISGKIIKNLLKSQKSKNIKYW